MEKDFHYKDEESYWKMDYGEGYHGQIEKSMRHGFGVYCYINSFFKYEGEWFHGVKQGHGMLLMRDGSYYKGNFFNGEIQGHGERYWAHSKNLYVGLFDCGEMNGEGVMTYGNGSIYEGFWLENKREGIGKLKNADGSIYNGSFHLNKPHGEGRMTLSNGEEFIGGWINGMRHGHGTCHFQDGSFYEGQWRCNQFHGEGVMTHSSGIYYDGLWVNGRPLLEPCRMMIDGDEPLTLFQDSCSFSLSITCFTEDHTVTNECGRMLKLSAGVQVVSKLDVPLSKSSESPKFKAKIENLEIELETYPLAVEVVKSTAQNEHSDPPVKSPLMDSFPQANEEDNIFISAPHLSLDEIAENNAPQPQKTNYGKLTFSKLLLPPLSNTIAANSSVLLSNNKPELRATNRSRKASIFSPHKVEPREKKPLEMKKKEVLNELKKDEGLNKMFCKPGDYVLIVEDVTENPFLDIRLKTIYYRIKVLPSEKDCLKTVLAS